MYKSLIRSGVACLTVTKKKFRRAVPDRSSAVLGGRLLGKEGMPVSSGLLVWDSLKSPGNRIFLFFKHKSIKLCLVTIKTFFL